MCEAHFRERAERGKGEFHAVGVRTQRGEEEDAKRRALEIDNKVTSRPQPEIDQGEQEH